jgi:hypothetical protein
MERNLTSLLPPVKVPQMYRNVEEETQEQEKVRTATPEYEELPSGHVEAGKKAATSVKGSQWLRDVETAFDDIRSKAQQDGLDAKLVTRQDATKIASARRKSLNDKMITENILNRLRNHEVKKAKRKTQKKNRRRVNKNARTIQSNTMKHYGVE